MGTHLLKEIVVEGWQELFTATSIMAFLTLALLEIVLGIDNVVFIAIVTGRLPEEKRASARKLGLALAAGGRIVLLFAITWVITLQSVEVFRLPDWWPDSGEHHAATDHDDDHDDHDDADSEDTKAEDETDDDAQVAAIDPDAISVKDLILLIGGLFLLGKGTWEIHHNLEGGGHGHVGDELKPADKKDKKKGNGSVATAAGQQAFFGVIAQILMLDLVFSIDSVLTAVGMVNPDDYSAYWVPLTIMITAVLVSIAVMLLFVNPLSRFVEEHPTFKMLALAFLLLIGVVLVAEGLHQHIPRGYIYFAMGFSLLVEVLNLQIYKRKKKAAK